MDSIGSMRKKGEHQSLFLTRARMADWMIEVFLVYQEKGSNEMTYFRALTLLDILIASGEVKESHVHEYGIACMYLASNILDSIPMSIGEAKRDLAHDQFTGNHILKYINKALSIFDFNLLHPTWIEYLDKLIYDIFGDYRESLANLSLRSSAVFVLNACAYEVLFYSWNPYHLAAIALLYGINCLEKEFETKLGKDPHNPDYIEARLRFKGLVEAILTTQKMSWENAQMKMHELKIYLETIQSKVTSQDYPHLAKLFRLN
jgi:hypothetical protein